MLISCESVVFLPKFHDISQAGATRVSGWIGAVARALRDDMLPIRLLEVRRKPSGFATADSYSLASQAQDWF